MSNYLCLGVYFKFGNEFQSHPNNNNFFMNSCAVGHFEVLARETGFDQTDCTMRLFWGRYHFCHRLLRICVGNSGEETGSKFVVHYSPIMEFDTT